MNFFFYPRIALSGIKNNKRLYYPFFFTCIVVVATFYIMCFITSSAAISQMHGSSIQLITSLGCYVIGVFAVLFLLYTNSFLTKRRMKEFGLYNVLGMSKKNIAIVLFCETLFSMILSLLLGLLAGILFSKLAELLLINIIKAEVSFSFRISFDDVFNTILLFAITFTILYLFNVFKIGSNKAIELVRAEEEGEKAPRANWILAVLGVIILLIAYYMAISVNNAFGALLLFFYAVLMVIVATYLLFISASVVLCKILQKNKNYYYRADHFISTSTMAFRMKRNGAGLATICILSTMVLVMISSSAALYFGENDAINSRFHHEFQTEIRFYDSSYLNEDNLNKIDKAFKEGISQLNCHEENTVYYLSLPLGGYLEGDRLEINSGMVADLSLKTNNIISLNLIPLADYNRLSCKDLSLDEGEALCYTYLLKYSKDTLNIADKLSYKLKKMDDDFVYGFDWSAGVVNSMCLVVEDVEEAYQQLRGIMADYDLYPCYNYNFDTLEDDETDLAIYGPLSVYLFDADFDASAMYLSCKVDQAKDFYTTYGGLFFVGIILSLLFIFATVLIIYYKQISEGYEDEGRFAIMKKIGLTTRDIKKTISSQMLTVFYLPLLFAVLHLCFALPMIRHLLALFQLKSLKPLLMAAGICVLLYALVYAIVYKLTTNTYYSIVNGSLDDE